jgi:hypothetical protein
VGSSFTEPVGLLPGEVTVKVVAPPKAAIASLKPAVTMVWLTGTAGARLAGFTAVTTGMSPAVPSPIPRMGARLLAHPAATASNAKAMDPAIGVVMRLNLVMRLTSAFVYWNSLRLLGCLSGLNGP